MILDWLIRHSQKEIERMSLKELQPELQPEPQPEPQADPQPEPQPEPEQKPEPQPEAEQAVVNEPTPAEPKAEDDQQSKFADALDALTVDKGQLATASSITAKDENAALALTSPGALKIEAPLHAQGEPYRVSGSLYSYASLASESAVDKLEAAFQERIFHMRTLLNHLGHEAEAEVMALFDKHPIVVD